ncbi:MAG: DUF309 domain-containing protein [Betaproteobacteria bacterium]
MMPDYRWDELARFWSANDFGAAHDWLGERWNRLIQERGDGHEDRDARFLQGLAFAALAFHFTQSHNQEGARLLADDALRVLPGYVPRHAGVAVDPVLDAVRALRSRLEGLDDEAPCPVAPRDFSAFTYEVTQ